MSIVNQCRSSTAKAQLASLVPTSRVKSVLESGIIHDRVLARAGSAKSSPATAHLYRG